VLAQPELLAETEVGAVRLAVNAGYRMRPHVVILGQTLADELTGRLGLGYRPQAAPAWEMALSFAGATAANQPLGGSNQNALEANAMVSYDVTPGLSAFVGAGPGLRRGIGTPEWRIFAGTRMGPARTVAPAAPAAADASTPAPCDPNAPGTTSGCPARDRDGDGLADSADRCPDQKEDLDGYEDTDGCPDPDNDHDGVLDAQDSCPVDAGAIENRGCPERDRDSDGVADVVDICPDERGLRDLGGCRRKHMVSLTRVEIAPAEALHFAPGSARIGPALLPVLDDVAAVIMAHSEISEVRVEVRCTDAGSERRNVVLSQRRADAVRNYLVRKGVFADRLLSQGLGPTPPRKGTGPAAESVAFVIDGNN
jgi:hypothetical protein